MAKPCVCVKCGHPYEQSRGLKPAQKHKEEKKDNPFAEDGKEKLQQLKAELEEKRRKIVKAIGEDEVVMVRFAYADGNRLKPIIITDKSKKAPDKEKKAVKEEKGEKVDSVEKTAEKDYEKDEKKKMSPVEKMQLVKMQLEKLNVQEISPHVYLAAVLILILLLVAVLKRQAELCSNPPAIVATR